MQFKCFSQSCKPDFRVSISTELFDGGPGYFKVAAIGAVGHEFFHFLDSGSCFSQYFTVLNDTVAVDEKENAFFRFEGHTTLRKDFFEGFAHLYINIE